MTDSDQKSALPPKPAAHGLLGWAFGPRAGLIFIGACGAVGAVLVGSEYVRPRLGLRLPFEEQAGFYAAVGAGAVAAALLVASALRWLLVRTDPYTDEEGSGVDHP